MMMMRKEICFIFTALFCFFLLLLPASASALAEDPEQEIAVIEEILPDIPSSIADTGNPESPDTEAIESTRVFNTSASDLAAMYINSVLPQKRPMLRVSRPSGLIKFPEGSENRNLYRALQSCISDLAEGTTSSSQFTINAKDIFKYREFTAGELGVETLFYETEGGMWAIETDAAEAIRRFFRNYLISNFDQIYVCLLEDSPYEFYWLDTQIHPILYEPAPEFSKPEGRTDAVFIRGTWTVSFAISRDYAQIPENWDGSSILTDMDPSRHEWVANARANVDEILSGAPEGDYDKMKYYRDQIRSLSTYNNNTGADYGDPWQLIWVFDGDPNTKVVCEGFAKAFSYLCELDTEEAYSMLARGWMQTPGMAKPGAHMWNVVRIEGRSYLVDVTNDNSAYELFLAGADDGTLADGYTIRRGSSTILYTYNRQTTGWDDSELTLSPLDYRLKCTEGSLHMEIPLGAGERQWIEFTPPETGEYAFYSTGEADSCGEIYSPEGTLAWDDYDSGAGSNFFLHTELQAGETYLLAACIQAGGAAGCPTIHIEPYIPMTSITGGYVELCPGEEGDITPIFTPENATNIGIEIDSQDSSSCVTVNEDGHVTAVRSGETVVRVTSIENPELEDYVYILVHEPVTISADLMMTMENGQVRIHIHGEESGFDEVNQFTMHFSESIGENGRFEYAGCEYSGTTPYPVAVNDGVTYEDQNGITNRLTIRSQANMNNDLPLNFDLTLKFNITDDNGLPEETLRLSITEFEIGCLSMANKEKVLPYTRHITIPVPVTFVLPGETTPLTDADMVLPAGIIRIEEEAFAGTGAGRIRLPEQVAEIGGRAFADCPNLTGIYIPASCEAIAEDAFAGTNGLVIYGAAGSAAQEYAERKGIVFVPMADDTPPD